MIVCSVSFSREKVVDVCPQAPGEVSRAAGFELLCPSEGQGALWGSTHGLCPLPSAQQTILCKKNASREFCTIDYSYVAPSI